MFRTGCGCHGLRLPLTEMAIKKHQEDVELNDRVSRPSTTTTTEVTTSEPAEQVSVPTLTQMRSQEVPCYQCPRRSVIFVREHTHLKRNPAFITCPNCLQGVETIVERRCTSTTHLSALLLLPVCFCAIPYCSKMLRDTIHRCPSCGIALGAHFASAHEAFVTCCTSAQQDHHGEGRVAATSGEAQFF